jgi:hypothetical protein
MHKLRDFLLPMIGAGLLCSLTAGDAWGGDFIDTRVTFTLGDDNFLKNAGEQVPDSPKFGIGDREGYQLFFDNLNQRTTGRENQLDLVLFKRMPGILPGLTTEAAAAVRLDMQEMQVRDPVLAKVLQDDSSYIRLVYAIDREKRGTKNLDLVLFPLSGDRFRVGYLYALTWAGADMFPRRSGPTPGFKLGGNHGFLYWWAGMKMVRCDTAPAQSTDEQQLTISTQNLETFYSALGGLGVQPLPGLSIDLSGAYVQMGENPIKDVAGQLVTAQGFSARVAYGRGLKVGLSSDLKLLRTDPEFIESLSLRPKYTPGTISWSISAETNAIAQVLADPDLYGATRRSWATAAAFDARLQWNYLRLNATVLYRSLEFILLNTPSFIPFTAFPSEAQVQPEFFAALSADYHFPRLGLTPGIQMGLELPAAVKTQLTASTVGSNAPATLIGEHTIVIRANGRPDILPEGEGRMPLFSVRLNTQWYASDFLTLIAFAFITYDQNNTILQVNPDLTKTRVFENSVRFGAGMTAQARF